MFVVAITRLETPIEDEAQALAEQLGTHAYDERRKLAAGFPAVIMTTRDQARAMAMLEAVQRRGHAAMVCDTAKVVPSSAMLSLRKFRFDEAALVAFTEAADELPWHDVGVLVRATHSTETRTTKIVKQNRVHIGRGLLPSSFAGGQRKKRETVTTETSEPVLYIFRRSSNPPWLLQQGRALYGALGPRLAPSAAANFALAITELVTRCPQARLDDRLATRKGSADELDVLAHLVATSILRDGSAYR